MCHSLPTAQLAAQGRCCACLEAMPCPHLRTCNYPLPHARSDEMSEGLRGSLNALLYRTGDQSKDFMVVLATNRPGGQGCAPCPREGEQHAAPLGGHQEPCVALCLGAAPEPSTALCAAPCPAPPVWRTSHCCFPLSPQTPVQPLDVAAWHCLSQLLSHEPSPCAQVTWMTRCWTAWMRR